MTTNEKEVTKAIDWKREAIEVTLGTVAKCAGLSTPEFLQKYNISFTM